MKLDLITNKQDEYYTPNYAIAPLIDEIIGSLVEHTTVWCPFDTEDSLIVKALRKADFEVIATHIANGQDFFNIEVPYCDIIISNPPYSLKNEVFERLFKIGKPFAMLVGVVGLFESQKRFKMFRDNNFEIMYLNKRVSYFKDYNDEKPALNPPFSSVWLCSKLLMQKIVFKEIIK
jgi:hypothetical protein